MNNSSKRIPRWLVENDPSWERSVDSDLGILKWTKKGTHIQAVCPPTSIFCQILGQTDEAGNLQNILQGPEGHMRTRSLSGVDDITKYLSSRYLNPGINDLPRFDLKKIPKW